MVFVFRTQTDMVGECSFLVCYTFLAQNVMGCHSLLFVFSTYAYPVLG